MLGCCKIEAVNHHTVCNTSIDMTTHSDLSKTFWDIDATAEYIVSRAYQIVTLQFPDNLLKDATAVAGALSTQCRARGQEIRASRATRAFCYHQGSKASS